MQSQHGNYSSSLNNYNPMLDDYNSATFNSYDRGPGRNLSLDHHPSVRMSKPSTTLYIVGIPQNLTNQGLSNIFSKFGKVLRCVMGEPKRDNGYGHRYGFIDYSNIGEAEEALHTLNNKPPYNLHIEFALSKEEKMRKEAAKDTERNQLQQQFDKQSLLLTPPHNDHFSLHSKENIQVRVVLGGQKTVSVSKNDEQRPLSSMSNYGQENNHGSKSLLEHFKACGPSQRPHIGSSSRNGVEQRNFDSGVVERKILSSSSEYKSSFVSHQSEQLPCSFCKQPGGFRCQRCKAWYCGQTCQLQDWPNHKKTCVAKSSSNESGASLSVSESGQRNGLSKFCNDEAISKPSFDNSSSQGLSTPRRPETLPVSSKQSIQRPQNSFIRGSFNDSDKDFKKPDPPRAPSSRSVSSNRQSEASFVKPSKPEMTEKEIEKPNTLDIEQKSIRSCGRSSRGASNGELRRPFGKPDMILQPIETTLPSPLATTPSKVRVCFIANPSEFYVHKIADSKRTVSEELETLSVEVHQQAVCEKHLNVPLQVGDYCIALFSVDHCWYRAKVLKVLDDKTHEVFFVDYGNQDSVQLANMRLLPEKLRSVPGQALECMLGKVAPLKGDWDAEAVVGFNMLVDGCVLNCNFFMQLQGKSVVGLADEEGSDVADLMVQLHYAQESALPDPIPLKPGSLENSTSTNKPNQKTCSDLPVSKPPDAKSPSPSVVKAPPSAAKMPVLKPPVLSILGSLTVKPDPLMATVTWIVDQQHFWALLCDEVLAQNVANLSVNLTMRHETDSAGFTTTANEVVSAKASDGVCYRAYIKKKLPNNSYEVVFIDFGNAETVSSVAPLLPEEKAIICPALLLGSDNPLDISLDSTLLLKMASVSPSHVTFNLLDNEGNEKSQLVGQPWFCEFFSEILTPSPSPPLEEPIIKFENMEKRLLNKTFQANVVWINSPEEMYLQLIEDVDTLAALMIKVSEFAAGKAKKVTPIVDQIVLARFEDGNWYRARVKKNSNQVVQVHFCDYGNSSDVSLEDILECPLELSVQPPFAVSVSLEGVKALSMQEQKLLIEEVWKVEMSTSVGDVLSVKLIGSNGQFKAPPKAQSPPTSSNKANISNTESAKPTINTSQISKSAVTLKSEEFYGETFSNQSYVNIPIGQTVSTTITSVSSPELIYMNYFPEEASTQKFLDLCEAIKKYCNVQTPVKGYSPALGQFCLAEFNEDLCWYRAVVLENSAGNFKVMFIDYGNMEVTRKILPIPKRFMEMPIQAAQCRLYGILAPEVWSDEVCEELRLFLLSNPAVEVTVNSIDDDGNYFVHIPTAREHMLRKKLIQEDPKVVLPLETSEVSQETPAADTKLMEAAPIATPSIEISEHELLKQQIKALEDKLASLLPK